MKQSKLLTELDFELNFENYWSTSIIMDNKSEYIFWRAKVPCSFCYKISGGTLLCDSLSVYPLLFFTVLSRIPIIWYSYFLLINLILSYFITSAFSYPQHRTSPFSTFQSFEKHHRQGQETFACLIFSLCCLFLRSWCYTYSCRRCAKKANGNLTGRWNDKRWMTLLIPWV